MTHMTNMQCTDTTSIMCIHMATGLRLCSTAVCRKQSKVGRVSHVWEEFNSSKVVIRGRKILLKYDSNDDLLGN